MSALQKVKISNAVFLVNKELGFFPYFQWLLRNRINKKKAVNVAVTGEAGEGKSYLAWTLCMLIDKRFSVNQIVFTYGDYMKVLLKLGIGRPIMFDEPSYAMGKRDWYKQVNQVLVKTMESQRFMVHPLFIPIINKVLLDKTIREHLLQFQVILRDRGKADVYRIKASQFQEKIYHSFICRLYYPLIGECPKQTCLGCAIFENCDEFRAQYERKKRTIQIERYEQAEHQARYQESKLLTDKQIEEGLLKHKQDLIDDKGRLNINYMKIIAKEKLGVVIGHNRTYRIRAAMKLHYPELFGD